MRVAVHDMNGREVGTIELPPSIFEAKVNRDLMHQALVRQMANARRGTHDTKTRAEVNRTTAKWYRQKGTGRARHGSKKAPIFVGGGVAHGPKPRSYRKDMPRKMRRAALRSALTVKAGNGDIIILDKLALEQAKTKEMRELLYRLVESESALVLVADRDDHVERSARNLSDVKALRASYLNIRDLLGFRKIVMPLAALDVIEGFLSLDETGYITSLAETAAEEEE
jgi:large subunit ribosomal protein L4